MILPIYVFAQENTEDKDKRRRLFINEFLQRYQSAYEKEEIEFISDFFSTNALIITETMQFIKTGEELHPRVTKKRPYKSIVEDKERYIERLKKLFDHKVKIKLSIPSGSMRVMHHPVYEEIYGVSFLQLWLDDKHLDDKNNDDSESQMPGYIFLMIDFKENELTPKIHVRTWQPKSNIKSPKDIYDIIDFRIYDF